MSRPCVCKAEFGSGQLAQGVLQSLEILLPPYLRKCRRVARVLHRVLALALRHAPQLGRDAEHLQRMKRRLRLFPEMYPSVLPSEIAGSNSSHKFTAIARVGAWRQF